MKFLAIDTATENCSCALYVDDKIFVRNVLAPQRHAELILNMLNELLIEAKIERSQLDGIAYGCGPGSFTGLRIACGVTQGISFALNLPVVAISSLAIIAQGIYMEKNIKQVAVAIDARMSEVYFGCYMYKDNIMQLYDNQERVCKPIITSLPKNTENWYGAGSGWHTYAEQLESTLGINNYVGKYYPQAQYMIPLALQAFKHNNIMYAENIEATYLRNNVASKKQ
jgi:tRNA threonylcarbamoyladenosine biosynthesis protein TsaB